jgi:hypothetical protein
MENLIYNISNWINSVLIAIAFIIALLSKKKKELFIIQVYLTMTFLAMIPLNICDFVSEDNWLIKLRPPILNLSSLLEITLIYLFIYKNLTKSSFRTWMIIFYSIFISLCAIIWLGKRHAFMSVMPDLFGFENLFISIAAGFYFYETIKANFFIDIKTNPVFIILSGILFFFGASTPIAFSIYTLTVLMPATGLIFLSVNSFLGSIFFFAIIKAYLCNIPVQKF